ETIGRNPRAEQTLGSGKLGMLVRFEIQSENADRRVIWSLREDHLAAVWSPIEIHAAQAAGNGILRRASRESNGLRFPISAHHKTLIQDPGSVRRPHRDQGSRR